MIWTFTNAGATQSVATTQPAAAGPQIESPIAEYGLLGGLRRRIEDWREYPPHGPIAISMASTNQMEPGQDVQTNG